MLINHRDFNGYKYMVVSFERDHYVVVERSNSLEALQARYRENYFRFLKAENWTWTLQSKGEDNA